MDLITLGVEYGWATQIRVVSEGTIYEYAVLKILRITSFIGAVIFAALFSYQLSRFIDCRGTLRNIEKYEKYVKYHKENLRKLINPKKFVGRVVIGEISNLDVKDIIKFNYLPQTMRPGGDWKKRGGI